MKIKQKGYILAVVLIMTFFMSMIIATTFTVAYRYYLLMQQGMSAHIDITLFMSL